MSAPSRVAAPSAFSLSRPRHPQWCDTIPIWRPATGEWLIVRSEDFSFYGFPFGANGDTVAPGDYDGDGKFDATVFRPTSATWFIARSTAGTQIVQFGANGDRPLPNAFLP